MTDESILREYELKKAANAWRLYAETARPEGLKQVSLAAASALEHQAQTGIAVCACCHKPFKTKMKFCGIE